MQLRKSELFFSHTIPFHKFHYNPTFKKIFYSQRLMITSPTLGRLNEGCLEHSPGPGAGHKAVWVPDHREHHGRGDRECILEDIFPCTLNVIDFFILKKRVSIQWYL